MLISSQPEESSGQGGAGPPLPFASVYFAVASRHNRRDMGAPVRSIWLAALCGFAALTALAAERAAVIADSAPMYSQMSSATSVVAVLHKGDVVTIEFTLASPDGTWCAVTQSIEGGKSGNLPCNSLEREQISEENRPAQKPVPDAPAPPITKASHIPRAPWAAQVHFVPLGNLASVDMPSLVSYYEQRFGLRVETLPAVPLDASTFNLMRQQNDADMLIALLQRGYPALANNRRAILIGITEADIYIPSMDWRFALGLRAEGRFAVVSSARMDLNHFDGSAPVDTGILHTRLKKMLSREIGFLYYRLPFSPDPRSVVRSSLMGVDELDEMGEDF
jgi:predicted Zn-dependent protease